MPRAVIVGSGSEIAPTRVTNDQMARIMDTNDQWIRERTGISTRHIAREDEWAADMGAEASREALERAGVTPGEVDLLIVSTATPDRLLPSTACDLQKRIGADNAFAFDVSAACSGWLYGLTMAEGFLASGRGDVALVVSAEKMSSIVDWDDRATCILFGDGSGAAVLTRAEGNRGLLSSYHRSDGELAELLYRPGGGGAIPMDAQVLADRDHLVHMSGREVFKAAVRSMADAAEHALERAGLTGDDIDLLVPHQANIRIIEATAKYAGIPMDRVYVNVDRYGNMSSATIPIALSEAEEKGLIGPGSHVLVVAFGAGFTWGALALRW
jgi:3-oxoacyl-[acyl-carrier-protein] synthase-3